jgi:polysaccharide export outer membrane protein
MIERPMERQLERLMKEQLLRRFVMKRVIVYVAVMLLAGVGNMWAAQDKKADKQDAPVTTARNNDGPADAAKPGPVAATNDPAYMIGPEDMLDINVWKEPDVSRIVPVRPDGRISLPLINDVQAAGISPTQLAHDVTDKLRKYFNDPQVTVIVTQINSQRVFVVGEVLHAGAFPLIPGMTVLQALSSAGGFTTFADQKKIHVMRLRDGKHVELPFNYRDVLKGDNPDQNIKLEPGDTVVVP